MEFLFELCSSLYDALVMTDDEVITFGERAHPRYGHKTMLVESTNETFRQGMENREEHIANTSLVLPDTLECYCTK